MNYPQVLNYVFVKIFASSYRFVGDVSLVNIRTLENLSVRLKFGLADLYT